LSDQFQNYLNYPELISNVNIYTYYKQKFSKILEKVKMNLLNVILNTLEFVVNLAGINTQENPNRTKFVKKLDVSDSFETGLASAAEYLKEFRNDPAPRTLVDVFRPVNDENNFEFHFIFKFMPKNKLGFEDPDSNMAFVLSQNAILLPDNISEYLQLNMDMHTYELFYTSMIRESQFWIHGILFVFLTLWGINSFMSFCLFINPYQYPFVLLTTLMDPLVYLLEALFPTILGWNVGYAFVTAAVAVPMDYLVNLSLTMPYLPSEATIQTVGDNSFYVFSGIPELWCQHGIPEEVRRDWFDQANTSIMQYYLRIIPPEWNMDVLPADIGRLKVLAREGNIEKEHINRAIENALRDLKAKGVTEEEVKTMIKEVKNTIKYDYDQVYKDKLQKL